MTQERQQRVGHRWKVLAKAVMEAKRCSGCFARACKSTISMSLDSRGLRVLGDVMGWKMVCPTELNSSIIGGLSNPDELSTDERSCLPEANVPAVCDIVGGFFKREILDSPKDVEITDWRSRVTSVSKTSSSNFLSCLWGNGIRNEPSRLLKALQNLLFPPDKDHVDRISICP